MSRVLPSGLRLRTVLLLVGAVVLAVVVFLVPGGAQARWALAQDLGTAGSVGSGGVDLDAAAGTVPVLTVDGVPFDPVTDELIAGSTLQMVLPALASVSGTTMVPHLSLGTSVDGSTADDWIVAPLTSDDVKITSNASAVAGGLAVGTDARPVSVTVDIEVAKTQTEGEVDLDDVVVALSAREGSSWVDSHAFPDLGVVKIRRMVLTEFTCDTSLGACGFAVQRAGGAKTVYWGDGTSSALAADGARNSHAYATPGVYQVRVDATYSALIFGNGSVAANGPVGLVSLDTWEAETGATSAEDMFSGATNLVAVATPPATVVNMDNMFERASVFNDPRISTWDVSDVHDMEGMFYGAAAFNQPLDSWTVSSVTTMVNMFRDARMFNQSLARWDVSSVTNMDLAFSRATSFNQPLEGWDVRSVRSMTRMFDGATSFNQPLEEWDLESLTAMNGMFTGATSFDQPLGEWDVSKVTILDAMFNGATSFDGTLEGWDVSGVRSMRYVFLGASSFDEPLEEWDVSAVTTMNAMFEGARSFDQPLEKWNMSSVRNIDSMFRGAWLFDQPLEEWVTSSMTSMGGVFAATRSFNQPLAGWTVDNVRSFNSMFNEALAFDQPLETWDLSSATSMVSMFSGTDAFNQPLSAWSFPNVVTMESMFSDAEAFDQPLDGWEVGNVTNMSSMFARTLAFDQPLNDWEVGNVTNMSLMFSGARAFDQPLDRWDVGHVTDMAAMFRGASRFSQDLRCWNVEKIPGEPVNFSVGSLLGQAPVWGTSGSCVVVQESPASRGGVPEVAGEASVPGGGEVPAVEPSTGVGTGTDEPGDPDLLVPGPLAPGLVQGGPGVGVEPRAVLAPEVEMAEVA